jgi:hypothetical protein
MQRISDNTDMRGEKLWDRDERIRMKGERRRVGWKDSDVGGFSMEKG